MNDEGKYLYCIIKEPTYRTFGSIGIGQKGDEVHTLNYRDLACVISSTSMTKYMISRENLMVHTKVIEEVMKDYTVLPVRFGTIASSADEVRSLLMKSYQEFKYLLRSKDNKVELGLKAFWKDMKLIYKEIADSNPEVKTLKNKLKKKNKAFSLDERLTFGEKVKEALDKKKTIEAENIIQTLRPKCIDFVLNDTLGDNMVLSSAFLVDRMQEREFDDLVEDLAEKYKDRYKFKYVGPSPPFNFVNLRIRWGAEE
jgi:hypothetical protein